MGLLAAATSLWAVFNAAELVSSTLGVIWVMTNVQYLSIASIPVLWFLFGTQLLQGTDDERLWFRGREHLLWVIPGITMLLVWTDPWWGLVRADLREVEREGFSVLEKSYGPWFWVHSSYSYALVLWGDPARDPGPGS